MPYVFIQPTDLRAILNGYTVDQLKEFARLCISDVPARKASLIDRLVAVLSDPVILHDLYDRMDQTDQRAVSAALANDGVFDAESFSARYGTLPKLRDPHIFGWGSRAALRPLDLFLFNHVIPDELRGILASFVPSPEPFVLPSSKEVRQKSGATMLHRASTAPAALHDLVATLRLATEGKLAVGAKTGRPSNVAVERLAERLLIADYFPIAQTARADETIRPFGLTMLVQATKLAQPEGPKLRLTRKGESWLRRADIDSLIDVWHEYLRSNTLDELSRIRALHGQQSANASLTPPAERRAAITAALKQCPVGEWIAFDDFARALIIWRHRFAIERSSYSALYVGNSPEYGNVDYGESGYWELVNVPYLRAMLWEYVATLGLIDLIYSTPEEAKIPRQIEDLLYDEPYFTRYDGLTHFRINSLGAYLLGLVPTYAPEQPPPSSTPLVVLANLDVVVTQPAELAPNDRVLLERLTAQKSETVHALDRERILLALSEGLTWDMLREFLTTRSAQALPDSVQTWLNDLERNSGRLSEAGAAVLFAVDDPILAVQLANDTTLKRFTQIASDRTLVVPAEHEKAFRRRLRQLGYGVDPRQKRD